MMPPGLALVAVSERAQEIIHNRKHQPQYYLSLRKALKSHAGNDTPFTPAVSLIIGLDGRCRCCAPRGSKMSGAPRSARGRMPPGCQALGMELFSESPSYAVTAVWLPEGADWKEFNTTLKIKNGITVAAGQDDFKGRIFRISHLGYYDELDMLTLMGGLERSLKMMEIPFRVGAGVSAVQQAFLGE